MSTSGHVRDAEADPTALPRWLAALIVGAIAIASLVAVVWPWLPRAVPTEVGTIRAQIEEQGAAGRISATAPNFEWNDAGGNVVRLSDLRGRVVVVNFWATWCLPCRQELPAMNRIASTDPGVVFVAIGGFSGDSRDRMASFFNEFSLDQVTSLFDSNLATSTRYGVLSLPTTFFVDRTGVIRHLEIGALPLTEDQLRRGVAKASIGPATIATAAPPDLRWLIAGLAVAVVGVLVLAILRGRRGVRPRERSPQL